MTENQKIDYNLELSSLKTTSSESRKLLDHLSEPIEIKKLEDDIAICLNLCSEIATTYHCNEIR